jgi:hypothetical protein
MFNKCVIVENILETVNNKNSLKSESGHTLTILTMWNLTETENVNAMYLTGAPCILKQTSLDLEYVMEKKITYGITYCCHALRCKTEKWNKDNQKKGKPKGGLI